MTRDMIGYKTVKFALSVTGIYSYQKKKATTGGSSLLGDYFFTGCTVCGLIIIC